MAAVDLIGKKITKIRRMTKREMRSEGWEDWNNPGMVVELEGGAKLFASRDEEGNGPGAMFGTDSQGNGFQLA